MQGFRNLIARRRPVSDPAAGAGAAPQDDPAQHADPASQVDPWEELQSRVTTAPAPKTCDMDEARAARDHIPRPERPHPLPRREWTPSTRDLANTAARDTATDQHPDPLADPRAEAPAQTRASSPPKIWDLDPPAPTEAPARSVGSDPLHSNPTAAPSPLARSAAEQAAPAASAPRAASERVKTRLLGFHTEAAAPDPFAAPAASGTSSAPRFPIGWIVVIEGPGRGASFTLTAGLSTVGRDADQTVTLDFGDTSISRERHISIAHDDEDGRTYIGHGGKTNIVRHNDRPLLTTEELSNGDTIKIGKTVLRFVGLCGDGFSWTDTETSGNGND